MIKSSQRIAQINDKELGVLDDMIGRQEKKKRRGASKLSQSQLQLHTLPDIDQPISEMTDKKRFQRDKGAGHPLHGSRPTSGKSLETKLSSISRGQANFQAYEDNHSY